GSRPPHRKTGEKKSQRRKPQALSSPPEFDAGVGSRPPAADIRNVSHRNRSRCKFLTTARWPRLPDARTSSHLPVHHTPPLRVGILIDGDSPLPRPLTIRACSAGLDAPASLPELRYLD